MQTTNSHHRSTMRYSTCSSSLVPLGFCLLVFFHGSLAQLSSCQQRQQSPRLSGRSDCQFQKITAREPNRQQVSEAGFSEFWDSYEGDELECAGVEVVRHTINPKGLLLPYYPNTPELVYVVRGQGIQGTVLPGCEETFETSFPLEGGREQIFDKHQKVYRYKEGDILALPAGAVHWTYNEGDTPIVVVALRDTSNVANQLDRNFKKFFLAGNPQSQMQQGEPWGQPGGQPGWQPGQQGGKPGWQPGGKPGWQPGQQGAKPGWQPGQPRGKSGGKWQPWGQPQGQPQGQPGGGWQPEGKPGWQPGQPGGKPSWQPGTQPSWQPGSSWPPSGKPIWQPGSQPGGKPSTKPSWQQPGSQPSWQQPGSQPSRQQPGWQQPGSQPGWQQPGSQPGWQQPGSQPGWQQPGSQPGRQQPGSQPGWQQPGSQPGWQPGSKPSTKPSWQPESQPSWQPGSQTGWQPGRKPSTKPSWQPGSQPITKPSWQPESHPSWQPESQPGSKPSTKPSFQPGDKPSFQPGKKPTLKPGSKPSWQPERPGGKPGEISQDPCAICRQIRSEQGLGEPCANCNKVGAQQEQEGFNMFAGFADEILQQVYNIEYEIVMQLKGLYDDRGLIVLAENFQVLIPEEQEQYFSPRGNGIEQTVCSTQFVANIANPSLADVYNPRGGRISTLNSHKLPVLESLQLSAERGVLYKNAVLAPHYNLNAHSIIYITSGNSRLQIVRNNGSPVFDDWVQEGQLIVVPQDFAVIKKAGEEGCEWVAFKTNDNAMTMQLAGRYSYIRALPEEVLMNSYNISREEAKSLKYNRKEGVVLSPRSGPISPIKKAENVVLKALFG